MRAFLIMVLALSLSHVSAQESAIMRLPSLAAGGRVYSDVQVMKVEPGGIMIAHSGGAARIPWEQLGNEVRAKLKDHETKTKAAHEAETRSAQIERGQAEFDAAGTEARAAHTMKVTVIQQFAAGALVQRLPAKGRVYGVAPAYIAGITGKKPGASWTGKVMMTGVIRFSDQQTYVQYSVVK